MTLGSNPCLAVHLQQSYHYRKSQFFTKTKLIWRFISWNYTFNHLNNANYKILERYFLLKNAKYFPQIVHQTAKQIDKISNHFILSCRLYLDIVKNSKDSFNAPSLSIFIDVEMLAFLPGVGGKHPIIRFAIGKTAILLDKHITNFYSVF